MKQKKPTGMISTQEENLLCFGHHTTQQPPPPQQSGSGDGDIWTWSSSPLKHNSKVTADERLHVRWFDSGKDAKGDLHKKRKK